MLIGAVILGWAAEGGGDQRAGGSLGVAQARPQGGQALLGLGQGGREVPGAQVRIVSAVFGGFLDARATRTRSHQVVMIVPIFTR